MARMLLAALRDAGHDAEVVSDLRIFMRDPDNDAEARQLHAAAQAETQHLDAIWRADGPPDLWFCYHPYYKSPDLIGPALCRDHGVAYVTAESSWSHRRNQCVWGQNQRLVLEGAKQAALNICLTSRDREGLFAVAPEAAFGMLPPFIDGDLFLERPSQPKPFHLVTVAMMRPGDKLESYRMLAQALALVPADIAWQLSIVGDGPCREEVETLFASFAPQRLKWHGERTREEVAVILAGSAVHVWPGQGEAYGLALLEAQAAGVPVIAQRIAGIPEVVIDGRTGILTPPGDIAAFAAAITALLRDEPQRSSLATEARRFVREERSAPAASSRLAELLKRHVESRP